MPTTTTERATSLNQVDVWVDREGVEHDVAAMSVRYKSNVVAFLERRAVRIVVTAMIRRHATAMSTVVPCVIGAYMQNGVEVAVECGATHEWSHGVWHGVGPAPSDDAFDVWADSHADALFAALGGVTHEDAVAVIRRTPLVARMLDDIAANRGGEDD